MKRPDLFLWTAFAFLYPFIVWPGFPAESLVVLTKHGFVALFLLAVAIVKALQAGTKGWMTSVGHEELMLLLGLTVTVVLSTVFSPEPWVAVLGSLSDYSDGLIWYLLMFLLAWLSFHAALRNPSFETHLAKTLILGGIILVGLAVIELLLGKGLYHRFAAAYALPMVTFPGKGHLAGYLAFLVALSVGVRNPWATFLLSLGVGLVYNRSSLIAFAVLVLMIFWKSPRWAFISALLIVSGVTVGMAITRLFPWAEVRNLGDPGTLEQRLYMWKAAMRGFADRPLFGWGGGVFETHWSKYLTPEELREFIPSFGPPGSTLVEVGDAPGADPVFLLENPEGGLAILRIQGFSSHNQFLDVAVRWGVLGLVLYSALLWRGILGVIHLSPAALALLVAHVFYLFWFAIPEQEGVLWLLWGVALARAGWISGKEGP